MYLVDGSVCPKMFRAGQAVLPFKSGSTKPIGLPSSSSIQMMITGGCSDNCGTGGREAFTGQGLFPTVDQLPDGDRNTKAKSTTHSTMLTVPCGRLGPTGPALTPHLPMLHHCVLPTRNISNAPLGKPPTSLALTGGLHVAPGCTCHHPAWLCCAQPRWPDQWPGGHPDLSPAGGEQSDLGPGRDA